MYPAIDPKLSKEPTGVRRSKTTEDQMNLLSQYIKDYLQEGVKSGDFFLHHSAMCDTLWLCGLQTKLLEIIPDKHIEKFVVEILFKRSSQLHNSSDKYSKLRHLKNSVPQGSVLGPLLLNIHIYDNNSS